MADHTRGELQGLITLVEQRLADPAIEGQERERLQRWRREMLLQVADNRRAAWGD